MGRMCSFLSCGKEVPNDREDGCCSDNCAEKRKKQVADPSRASAIAQNFNDFFLWPHGEEDVAEHLKRAGY